MWEIVYSNYILFLLVFTRMTGMLLFNPFFARRNIPAVIKIGLALILSFMIMPTLSVQIEYPSLFVFTVYLIKELLIGYVFGLVINIFISWIFMAGEIVDLQLGISMSKIYDPSSNVSMPLTGSIYNVLYILIFFVGNGHLSIIKIMARSCQIFPCGSDLFNTSVASFIVLLLGDAISLAAKMAMPILAIELLTEAGLGVLMRTVPQINVFVVGLQLKLLVGLYVIIAFLPSAANLMDDTTGVMFDQAQKALSLVFQT
ncbi:MAG: flagellar biosynthetic protein FliR [Eubacteriales bacterium]